MQHFTFSVVIVYFNIVLSFIPVIQPYMFTTVILQQLHVIITVKYILHAVAASHDDIQVFAFVFADFINAIAEGFIVIEDH